MWSRHFLSSSLHSLSLSLLSLLLSYPQRRQSKSIRTCFWNVTKLLEVRLPSRPPRPGLTDEERREVVEPAWPVWKVKHQFAPWASWETLSLTVSGKEASLSSLFLFSLTSFRFEFMHFCDSIFVWFQFPVAGGALRGWIMPCTALMCWLPSPQWLCLTFFTPPTGSPLTLQLLFSGRWANLIYAV